MTEKIKICGLKCPQDIIIVNEVEPDYIGFVFAKSSRRVTKDQAAGLREKLKPSINAVGVFVNESPDIIVDLYKSGIIQIVQLHGQESVEYTANLKRQLDAPIIKAVKVETAGDIRKADKFSAEYILLDNGNGGTGVTFDWSFMNGVGGMEKPFFLAGGIGEDNIESARKQGAFCLDVSSKAEVGGFKNREKIVRIMAGMRRI